MTRLIVDEHDARAFAPLRGMTVGAFREWLLSYDTGPDELAAVSPGVTPEMAAAVSKLMRNQDLVLAAHKCRVVTRFRSTVGLPGRLSVRLQPNHPTDDPAGITAAITGYRRRRDEAILRTDVDRRWDEDGRPGRSDDAGHGNETYQGR